MTQAITTSVNTRHGVLHIGDRPRTQPVSWQYVPRDPTALNKESVQEFSQHYGIINILLNIEHSLA